MHVFYSLWRPPEQILQTFADWEKDEIILSNREVKAIITK